MGSQEEGCFALYKIRPVPRQRVQRPQKPIGCPEERSGEAPPHVGVSDKINEASAQCNFSAGEDGERRSGLAGGVDFHKRHFSRVDKVVSKPFLGVQSVYAGEKAKQQLITENSASLRISRNISMLKIF